MEGQVDNVVSAEAGAHETNTGMDLEHDPPAASKGELGEGSPGVKGFEARRIKEGDTLVLEHKINPHTYEIRLMVVKSTDKVTIAKGNISHSCLIGHPFGTMFEVTKVKGVVQVAVADDRELEALADELNCGDEEGGDRPRDAEPIKDNRELVDWGSVSKGKQTNQKLGDQEVAKLKKEGASGKDLIKTIAENSETFKSKTEFSQEKWVKRKASKHLPTFVAHRCSSYALCRGYFLKDPNRTCQMREDALARLLTLSNVQPGSRALVCDSMNGMLLAAVAERLGGMGRAMNGFNTPQPSVDAVRWMNFDKAHLQTIVNFPLHELSYTQDDLPPVEEPPVPTAAPKAKEEGKVEAEPEAEPEMNTEERSTEERKKEERKTEERKTEERKTDPLSLRQQRLWSSNRTYLTYRKGAESEQTNMSLREVQEELREEFDSLVVGGSINPVHVMPTLIKHLRPSSPFIVYSQFHQPLLETMEVLIKQDECVDMAISETWMREYQVLPGRTHPLMQMTSASGFILAGSRVLRDIEKPAPVPNSRSKQEYTKGGEGAEKRQRTDN